MYLNLDAKDQKIDRRAFEEFMGQLIWEGIEDQKIMRCKGSFISDSDSSPNQPLAEFILQG